MRLNKSPSIITVYQDDREKDPWSLDYLGSGFKLETMRLKTGDYTLKGMEKLVCIEKKSGWKELIGNVSNKANRVRFVKLLRRMEKFPVRIMVVHADPSKIMLTHTYGDASPSILYGWFINIVIEYGVTLMPVGPKKRAQPIIRELLKRLVEYNYNGRLHSE